MNKAQFNIAHILPWDAIGGTELATLRIARAVESENFRSIMFCPSGSRIVSPFFASEGFETVSYEPIELDTHNFISYSSATIKLTRSFRRHHIDLIHCADIPAGNYAALAGKIARIPLVCHVRNRYHWLSRFERAWLLGIDKLICVSQDTRQQFGHLAKYGDYAAKRKGKVIYDGMEIPSEDGAIKSVKEEVKREFGIPEKAKIIGMVARLAPQKDYLTLIKAVARLAPHYSDVRFLIIGAYSQAEEQRKHFEEVQRAIHEHKVDDFFIFTDFRTDVPRLMNALDIFVLCTHFEGFPLVILEAMALGKPVVATAVDGIPEVIIDSKTGLLHNHEDYEHLAQQLLLLLWDKDFANSIGEAGRQYVQMNFNQRQFALNMINLYREMLKIKGYSTNKEVSQLPEQSQLEAVVED
jgi:glycosyltransferase involved in cell wall biosynthesis